MFALLGPAGPGRTHPSIRFRLGILVVASVIPAAAMVFALVTFQYFRELDELKASSRARARAIALSVDQRFAEVEAALGVLATSRLLWVDNLSYFRDEAVEVQALQKIAFIGLIDAQRQPVLSTLSPYGTALRPFSSTPYVEPVFGSGRPVVTDLFTGSILRTPIFSIGYPVRRPAGVVYALLAGISPVSMRDLLLAQQLPAGWIASIYDSSGSVVARTHEQERFVGKKGRAALRLRMQQVPEDVLDDGVTLDGTAVLTVFSRAPRSNWAAVIGIPRDSLTEGLRQTLAWLLAATALLLAASFGLAWHFGRQISQSVRALSMTAAQLGRRERVTAPPSAFAEANELGLALEQASRDLHHADAERVENELQLHQADSRLAGLVDSVMDAIITIDADQRIVLFNRAAENIFGRARGDVLGQSLLLLMPERFHHGHGALVHRFGQTGDTARRMGGTATLYGVRASGQEFPIEASISHLDTGDGKLFTVVVRDVTERARAHEALLRSNTDLQQFAFVASHDLRSPLRSIRGYLGILSARHAAALDAHALDLIARASAGVEQMDLLTEDLLSYARLDSQAKALAAVDCNEVFADAVRLLDAAISQAGAKVRREPLPTLQADRGQLVQLFQNLIANAITYCKPGERPQVAVRARREQSEWIFTVADNGIGIDPSYQSRIFEVFKRLHTQQEFPGNGIGLAICQRIVERHGGRIWVESSAGAGSTFFFTIPDPSQETS